MGFVILWSETVPLEGMRESHEEVLIARAELVELDHKGGVIIDPEHSKNSVNGIVEIISLQTDMQFVA